VHERITDFNGVPADGANEMKKRGWFGLAAAALLLGAAAFYTYQWRNAQNSSARSNALAMMPADASAVLFADFAELRTAPFVAQLFAWAPKPQADPDYAQFLKETGFEYERDLDRVAIAFVKHAQDSTLFAVADGRFDRQKISSYAVKTGTVAKAGGREIFSVPMVDSTKSISFTFLRNNRIALTDSGDLGGTLGAKKRNEDSAEWRSRFERLGGSPVFAVIRQDAAAGAALAAQAPRGLRSPQLSILLDQLQWITLAGKPENDRMRVIAEGECTAEATTRQLANLLQGVLVLAEDGLNDAKIRQQLDPAARAAYLELLKSADVSKIDRGDTKSVRLTFEVTPAFLEAARAAPSVTPGPAPRKPLPKNAAPSKGHI
jgi:hypothetical protein